MQTKKNQLNCTYGIRNRTYFIYYKLTTTKYNKIDGKYVEKKKKHGICKETDRFLVELGFLPNP
jgi:hypothetical protein